MNQISQLSCWGLLTFGLARSCEHNGGYFVGGYHGVRRPLVSVCPRGVQLKPIALSA